MRRQNAQNAHERWTVPCAAYAALCRSGVHDLRVVTRSYSLSQLSLLKKHETMVSSHGRFQSADRLIRTVFFQTLHLQLDDATDESWLIEPAATEFLIERINEYLDYPKSDIRSTPILVSANKHTDYSD